VNTPVSSSPAAEVVVTDSGSREAAEKTRAPVSAGSAAHDEELASLRADNEKLQAEIKENRSAETRLTEQMEQLRGELCESSEKLSSLYAQVQSDTAEMQVLKDQYAALQEQYADVVNAHKLELEQLYKQLSEGQSQVETTREERSVLEQEAAPGQGDHI
jgi:chromosome segregation ATPase